jgi:4,5-DOPA dioxygenase extradiol
MLTHLLYPDASVPQLQISLDATLSPREHFELGKRLAFFRNEGVLLVGSGNLIHNLRQIDFRDEAEPFPWAQSVDAWLDEKLTSNDLESLMAFENRMPHAELAVPTSEHYLPMLYALAARQARESLTMLDTSIQNGSIAMRSFEIK